jgi:MoxR-like ATPase
LRGLQRAAEAVKFDEALVGYLLAIVTETREHEALEIGVSPRGTVAMRRAAQARALVDGRDFCIPEDVRDLAVDVFAHRITVDPRSHHSRDSEETSWIVREILETLPIPL